ncbi:MAG: NAD-dependent dehydratase [Euryarchaeota archaeon HGW-Euryarchaeota-1]|nr:MAG: NAD-dependent dehydratase [Euryarchaeota archaeon HGW-Euryarchaeota-1]
MKKVLITGDMGFIGRNLTDSMRKKGYFVKGADIKRSFNEDLRNYNNALRLTKGIDCVYHLAAVVGGIGFLSNKKNHQDIFIDNSLINLNIIRACKKNNVKKILFVSSACVYFEGNAKESDTNLAKPENIYGWEKLNAEKLFNLYSEDIDIKIVRLQNIYGPYCKLKNSMAVADICQKVIKEKEFIEIWGTGCQVRNWVYVTDCVDFLINFMESNIAGVINLGTDYPISINELAEKIIKISKKRLKIKHIMGPTGTLFKSSDNSLRKSLFDWEPKVSLDEGLKKTYTWINNYLNSDNENDKKEISKKLKEEGFI